MEKRKDVIDYEGKYEVSNLGRIRNKKRGNLLKPVETKIGYQYINLATKGVKYCFSTFTLHRIIAKTFIPNPNNLPEVNHKNGIKSDNRIENLERMTKKENQQHSYKRLGTKIWNTGMFGKLNHRSKSVIQYNKDLIQINEYDSMRIAMKETGIKGIWHNIHGKSQTAGGYIRKYK